MPMSKLDKLTHAYDVIYAQYLLQKESGHDTSTLRCMLERTQEEINKEIRG